MVNVLQKVQTAKCSMWADKAHQPVAKICTSLHQAGQKSTMVLGCNQFALHRPEICTSQLNTNQKSAVVQCNSRFNRLRIWIVHAHWCLFAPKHS